MLFGINTVPERVILQSLNLETGQVREESAQVLTLKPNERLAGFSSLSDGTLMLVSNSLSLERGDLVSRLTLIERSPKSQIILGLPRNNTIESLLVTNQDKIIAIVGQNGGTPPFRLAGIDRQTSQAILNPEFVLPPEQRVSNLTQCPNGAIYVTLLSREGTTSLGQLDLQERKLIRLSQLRVHDRTFLNDLKSLACSPTGQLYGLGDPEYQGTNSLFTVDVSTGAMSFVRDFGVDKIAFARLWSDSEMLRFPLTWNRSQVNSQIAMFGVVLALRVGASPLVYGEASYGIRSLELPIKNYTAKS